MTEYLDPTDSVAVSRKTAPRPASLDGKVITLLDISKAKGDHLLDRIEELLRERVSPKAIVRKKKALLTKTHHFAAALARHSIAKSYPVLLSSKMDHGTWMMVHGPFFAWREKGRAGAFVMKVVPAP